MDFENITKSELDTLVKEAHNLFADALKKSQSEGTAALAKDEDGAGAPSEGSPDEASETAEAPSPSPSAPPASESEAPAGGSACPTCGAGGPPDAGPSEDPNNAIADTGMTPDAGLPPAPGQDPAQDQGVTPEQLSAEYGKLDPQSLEAHFMAIKQVIEAKMAQSAAPAPQGMGGTPAPAPAAAPAAPAAAPAPAPAMKSETEINDLKKSNKELETKVVDLSKTLDMAINAINKITQPMRKSFTGIDVKTPEEVPTLSKSEIRTALNKKVESGNLSKHELDTVMHYFLGEIDVSAIKHLLS